METVFGYLEGGAGIESSGKLQNFNWLSNRWLLMSSFQTLVPRSISVQVLKCTPMFCLLAQQTGHESAFESLVFVQSSLELISCRNDTSLSYFAQTNATVHPFLCCYEWLPYSAFPKWALALKNGCCMWSTSRGVTVWLVFHGQIFLLTGSNVFLPLEWRKHRKWRGSMCDHCS